MMEMEKIILKELGYETFRLLDLPHKFLPTYIRSFKVSNELARLAWNYLNDSFRLPLVVFYPANDIAASCLYLAMRKLEFSMPDLPWWTVCGTSLRHVQEICAEILNIYNIQTIKLFLEDVKSLVESNFKKKFSEYKYYEPFQEETQPRVDFRSAKVPVSDRDVGEAANQIKPTKQIPLIDPNKPKRRLRRSRSRSLDKSKSIERRRIAARRGGRRSRSKSKSRSMRRGAEFRRVSRRDRRSSRSMSSRSRRQRRSKERDERRGTRRDGENGDKNFSRNKRDREESDRYGRRDPNGKQKLKGAEQDIEAQIVADEEEEKSKSFRSALEDENEINHVNENRDGKVDKETSKGKNLKEE
jgi:hypothetical protein